MKQLRFAQYWQATTKFQLTKKNMKNALLLLSIIFISACGNDDDDSTKDYKVQNEAEIKNYLASNNLIAQNSNSGLHYIIESAGSGTQPRTIDNVTVAYKGYYTSGSVFDESNAKGISFNLQQVIKGWTEGIPYFKEGGSGKLFVPAHLGYGSNDYNGIPGGSVLIFDIHLIAVN